MKTIPMIFNSEMVRALIDGRKTQTRRPLPAWQKPQKTEDGEYMCIAQRHPKWGFGFFGKSEEEAVLQLNDSSCSAPFGKKGDLIWVRETFQGPLVDEEEAQYNIENYQSPQYCSYKASGDDCEFFHHEEDRIVQRWKPSIHMPRWASRLTLRVLNVRVERVQTISKEDAAAEGVITEQMAANAGLAWRFGDRRQFKDIWESIYGDSWKLNDWVWVIEFEVIPKNVDLVLSDMRSAA